MAIPVVESFTVASTSGLDTLPIAKPSGVVEGDLMVAFVGSDSVVTYTASGWIQLHEWGNSGSIFYKVAGGSEASTYDFVASGAVKLVGGIVRITGQNATPIDSSDVDNSSGINGVAPDITTTTANCLVLRFLNVDSDPVDATPSTEIWIRDQGGVAAGASEEDQASAGATGTAAFTHGTDTWNSATVAIAEAAGGGDVFLAKSLLINQAVQHASTF